MENQEKNYEQPLVEIIEVEVEQGFAASAIPYGDINAWKDGGEI